MSAHSPLVGGSSAERLLHCPGSYHLIMKLPYLPELPSEAAAEGTFCHHVMDALLRARLADSDTDLKIEAAIWLSTTFHDRILTQTHLDTLIFPALDALAELEHKLGGGFKVMSVEQTFEFPGVPSAFGTVDLVLQSNSHVIIADYKFGSWEVATVATHEDGGETLNSQLAYYAAAALYSKPRWFNGRAIAVAIIQPRGEQVLDYTVVDRKELTDFAEDVAIAVAKALGRDAPLSKGRWCKWCPAKITCPKWTGPLLALGVLAKDSDASADMTKVSKPFGDYLSRAKEFTEMLTEYSKEVDRQLLAYLIAGGTVPGWTLAPKKKLRQWIDEETVAKDLRKLGFSDQEIFQRKLQTFAAADAAAKKRGKKIPDHLRVAPPSTEMVPVRSDGPYSLVDKSSVIEQLKASVALLDGKAADQS